MVASDDRLSLRHSDTQTDTLTVIVLIGLAIVVIMVMLVMLLMLVMDNFSYGCCQWLRCYSTENNCKILFECKPFDHLVGHSSYPDRYIEISHCLPESFALDRAVSGVEGRQLRAVTNRCEA